MKTKTILILLLLVVMGCGCRKIDEKEIIFPLINDEVEMYFLEKMPMKGEKSNYFGGMKQDFVYIINSKDEFRKIFGNVEISNVIDFDKNTLIVGQKRMPNLFYTVNRQFMERKGLNYVMHLGVAFSDGSYPAFSWLYFWGIYPKISEGTNITIHIDN
ncbi:hypothetical protein ACI76O_04035 [Capnocytophaga cynodegmi]|uniref:hypothetical protein n=1 Tax=Capnocytophaga cynodegmi TaxID=28189 RepID=UPI00385E5EBF